MINSDRYISTVLGVKVDRIQLEGVLKKALFWIENKRKSYIVTPNPEMVVLAQKDKEFMTALNGAGVAVCDGVGLKLADFKLKRVTGGEVVVGLVRLAARKRLKVMLIGGKEGVAKAAAERLRKRFEYKNIKGERGLKEVKTASEREQGELVKAINRYQPEILLVAFGHGQQEKWIHNNLGRLKVRVAMGVGGVFDQLVNPKLKAPKWMKQSGLEWFYRLAREPWRIKRQGSLLRFVWLLLVN